MSAEHACAGHIPAEVAKMLSGKDVPACQFTSRVALFTSRPTKSPCSFEDLAFSSFCSIGLKHCVWVKTRRDGIYVKSRYLKTSSRYNTCVQIFMYLFIINKLKKHNEFIEGAD